MKCLLIFVATISLLNSATAQLRTDVKTATTTSLPEGTSWKDGKIIVAQGYKATYSPNDNKVVIISTVSNNPIAKPSSVSGTFTCVCSDQTKTNDCSVMVRDYTLTCIGEKCGSDCRIYTTIKPSAGFAITRETKGVIWKKFVFPSKTQ